MEMYIVPEAPFPNCFIMLSADLPMFLSASTAVSFDSLELFNVKKSVVLIFVQTWKQFVYWY